MFDLLLKYAVSEDGALHAEKYYRTAREEFAATRPAFRWRQLVALARVTASDHTAGGCDARFLFFVSWSSPRPSTASHVRQLSRIIGVEHTGDAPVVGDDIGERAAAVDPDPHGSATL